MRRLEGCVGLALAGAIAISLPIGLAWVHRTGLRVHVDHPAPHVVVSGVAQAARLPGVRVSDPSGRSVQPSDGDPLRPGIELQTWRVVYAGSAVREATVPVLVGPFDDESVPWPCTVALKLPAEFFDDGQPGGGDVAGAIERAVRGMFPWNFASRPTNTTPAPAAATVFAPALNVSVRLALSTDRIRAPFAVTLENGTRFSGTVGMTYDPQHGYTPTGTLEAFRWVRGTSTIGRGAPNPQTANLERIAVVQFRRAIVVAVTEALTRVMPRSRPPEPLPGPGQDRLGLRLCEGPSVTPDGVLATYALAPHFVGPAPSPDVRGPVHLQSPPRLEQPSAPARAGRAELVASPAALNHLLYILWRTRRLSAWGSDPITVAALRQRIGRLQPARARLEPRLPPTLSQDAPRRGTRAFFQLADTPVGQDAAGRTVIVHGDLSLTVSEAAGSVTMVAGLNDLRTTCATGGPGRWTLEACGTVPAMHAGVDIPASPDTPLDSQILDRLAHRAIGEGDGVVTDDVIPAISPTGQLLITAQPRVVDR